MKDENLEEHSGWSAATAPMRKPGVSLSETPFADPARGGIGGFGEAVFRVRQSRCLWLPPQKRHGPIFASYGRSFPHLLFLTREAVSAFVRGDGSDARSELGDHLSEVISGGRIAG